MDHSLSRFQSIMEIVEHRAGTVRYMGEISLRLLAYILANQEAEISDQNY